MILRLRERAFERREPQPVQRADWRVEDARGFGVGDVGACEIVPWFHLQDMEAGPGQTFCDPANTLCMDLGVNFATCEPEPGDLGAAQD